MPERRDGSIQGVELMTGDASASWPIWLPRRLLSIDDLSRIFQVSPRTARRMVDSGRLPRAPLGRLVRVRPETVLALLNGQQVTRVDNNTEDV
jgi:excisionase family DNA binding protein